MARVKSPSKPTRARKKKKASKAKAAKKKASKKTAASKARRSDPDRCPITQALSAQVARRGWVSAVQSALASGRPATLVLFDVDGFARHEQDLGRKRADELLKEVATRLTASLPGPARLGRIAGDLFGVILETELELAIATAETARKRVFTSAIRVGRGVRKRSLEASVSAGLASLRRDAEGLRELVGKAQSAVWRAKSLGGNRVGLAEHERMSLKTSYYSQDQLARLKVLAARTGRKESVLLREALEDLFLSYKDRRPEDGEGVSNGPR